MVGRNGARGAVADAAEELTSYGGDVVADEKLRQRLLAALAAGVGAQQRAKQQAGVTGMVRRLARDPVLRAQLTEMVVQLQGARQRVGRRRSHRLRNSLVLLAGFGAASAVVAVPSVRERILAVVGGLKDKDDSATTASAPTMVTDDTEVEAPLATGGRVKATSPTSG